jgi:hypothetical protein
MAEACHRAFNERFALEALLANAQEMHRRAKDALGFAREPAAGAFDATVVIAVHETSAHRFKRCFDSVLRQTLPARRIVVLDGTAGTQVTDALRRRPAGATVERRRGPRRAAGLAPALARIADGLATEWVCCLSADDILYPNHLFAAAEAAQRHRARSGGAAPGLVYSGLVQISDGAELPELMHDHYNVRRTEHMRLAQFDFGTAWASALRLPVHPASCLLHVPSIEAVLRRRWLMRSFPPALGARLRALAGSGRAAFTAAVTVATSSPRLYSGYGQFALPAP